MATGVYQIDRDLWDHPFFREEPYTEKQAWAWLIGQAAWQGSRTVAIGRRVITLQRGQVALSYRFLGSKWLWTKDKVERYINRAKHHDMVRAELHGGMTVLTLCNYDKYQFGRDNLATDTETDFATPTATTSCDNKSLLKKNLRTERISKQEHAEVSQNEQQKSPRPESTKPATLGPAPPPDPWLQLKTDIITIREQATGHYTICDVLDTWKASGYEVEICRAVIMGKLREDPTRSLGYMPKPLAEAHATAWEARRKAVAPPPPKPKTDWPQHLAMLKRLGEWPMALGPKPGLSGCKVPHQDLIEFGFLPANERISA